jgi:protein-tyrosine phosphatase
MDGRNVRNINMIFGGDPDGKVMRLLDLTERCGDVADPWYTGDFTAAYDDILRGCAALLEYLQKR